MATIDEIKQQAEAVKNATQVGENTAERVGGALAGLAELAEQQDTELGKKANKMDMDVEQMIHAGFSITTTATVLNRTVPAVRRLCKMAYTYLSTSRVYRLATAQATLLNKDVEPICV